MFPTKIPLSANEWFARWAFMNMQVTFESDCCEGFGLPRAPFVGLAHKDMKVPILEPFEMAF